MLDKFRETAITWDKATSRIYSPVTANASDENGRKLVVQIINGGEVEVLTGAALHLYWETRDKLHNGLDVFKAVDLEKGEFELSYTTGMLSNIGELNATLVLVDSTGKVVSDWFKITVARGIDDDAIQSENSFTTLTQALIDISNLEQNYAPRLNDLTAQLQQTMAGKINAEQFIDIKTALENSVGKTLEIPAGVYTLDDKVDIVGDINIVCLGDVVIDARNNPHDIAISLGGKKTNNTFSLTTNANKGSKRISLTDTRGLKQGDILHIVSSNLWNPTRTYYRKGELVKIESVTSNSVDIVSPLYDTYTPEEILVIEQIEPKNIFLDGLKLLRDGINTGIEINYANVELNSVSVNKANVKGISLNYCYGGYVNNGTTDCDYYERSGLSYGLSINSSYNINVNGGFYKAGRHGVHHGGWIPCRNIKHLGVTVDNDEVANVGAFDSHGNVEFLSITNLTSLNGIAIGASNFDFSNSIIRSRSTNEAIRVNVGRSCEYMRLEGVTLETTDTKNMLRIDSTLANQFTVKDMVIKNITVITPEKITESSSTTGSLFFADINVIKCSISDIYYKSNHTDSVIAYTLELKDSFIYDTLEIANVIIHSAESVLYLYIPDNSVAYLSNIDFKSNILDRVPVNIQGLGNLTIDNIIIDGSNSTARANIRPLGYVHVNNMTLKNFKGESVRFDKTLDLQVNNVKLIGAQQPTYQSTIPYVSKCGYGQRIFMYPQVPAIGNFAKGDKIINSNPIVGQPKGWICTVDGTPGTWVSEGVL